MTQKTNTKWISRIFPIEHDFFGMLDEQAKITLRGVEDFAQWLDRGEDRLALGVLERQREADEARFTMEEVLVDSFSTPIDRGDLYEVSRQMDAVLDYVGDAVQEASALEILPPQPFYAKFGVSLAEGMRSLAAAVHHLGADPATSEREVKTIRKAVAKVREVYFDSLTEVAHEPNVNVALRRREIYHHLKDAGVMLDRTTDILHRIIVKAL